MDYVLVPLVILTYLVAPPAITLLGAWLVWRGRTQLRQVGGVALLALGVWTIFWEVRWWTEYCWETDRPCDGSALDVLPVIGALTCAALVLAFAGVRLVTVMRRTRRPFG